MLELRGRKVTVMKEEGTHNSSAHPIATTIITANPTEPATKILLFLNFQHVVLSTRLPSSEHPEISTGTVNAAL